MEPGGRSPRILHVVEALGGGVMVAVRDYVHNAAGMAEHVVFGAKRPGHDTGDFDDVQHVAMKETGGSLARHLQLVSLLRALRPDLLHLHSSWAGVLGRTIPFPRTRTIYTPHCYAFERRDSSRASRALFFAAEKALARRAGAVFAVSPREVAIARSLDKTANTFYIPNVAAHSDGGSSDAAPASRRGVVAIGRVMEQKDPSWFAAFARALLALAPGTPVTWFGAGDGPLEQELRNSGVEVTGWRPRAEVLSALSNALFYVHSAAWEGAPLTVYEAAARAIPVVGRRIGALESLGLRHLFDSPVTAAAWVAAELRGERWKALSEESAAFAASHTPATQQRALADAYSAVLQSARAR